MAPKEELSTGGGRADNLHTTSKLYRTYKEIYINDLYVWVTRSMPRLRSAKVNFSTASMLAKRKKNILKETNPPQHKEYIHIYVVKVTRVVFATSGFETQLGSFLAPQFTIWKSRRCNLCPSLDEMPAAQTMET